MKIGNYGSTIVNYGFTIMKYGCTSVFPFVNTLWLQDELGWSCKQKLLRQLMIIHAKCLIFGQTRSDSHEECQSSLTSRNIKNSARKTKDICCIQVAVFLFVNLRTCCLAILVNRVCHSEMVSWLGKSARTILGHILWILFGIKYNH